MRYPFAAQWDDEMRRLEVNGRVVISQTPTDPGDIGEPRVSTMDDTTYVSVPEFELWPTDPDWTPSDASIVFIEGRSLTMARPGRGVYHLSRRWTYGSVTRCGRIIWAPTSSPEHEKVSLVPIRRDNASRIARPCRICGAETEEP